MIASEKANYPVTLMCESLEVSRSGYYASRGREPSKRARENAELVAEIREIHRTSRGTYGSPRVHVELGARDFQVGRHRVARLMRDMAHNPNLNSDSLYSHTGSPSSRLCPLQSK